MADSSSYDPMWMLRAPLGGDVMQRIAAAWFSPSLTVNYAGNTAIEERVVTEVAGYGKQLGWLSEILLALADGEEPPAEALDKLKDAVARIEEIKTSARKDALGEAARALDRLAREEPEDYEALIRARYKANEGD